MPSKNEGSHTINNVQLHTNQYDPKSLIRVIMCYIINLKSVSTKVKSVNVRQEQQQHLMHMLGPLSQCQI